ncbi:MAG: hypothetical protein L0G63_03145 [Psychrobacter sp.]|jgi:hypothetical protein|uniref:hypothetical protein n=1 Tax=Psychrobacter TaxID=497 RepID=UPI00086B338E|nr:MULTISPECIES: hypothetical protein [Psychrobacter]MCH1781725.1 hypothetical protein [Psychrobacter glaciei]MDN5619429.1 hypothetical protein [Psychrobacter sp.]MDN5619469.1 hypothetical protein [Psychrobacter sp.]OEH68515.1 MAG: hypothetical protein BAX61_07125 [Psychrobacter sp. B29-1]|tara:strand:+ start:17089 stop:17481 length:393 start_codon:yes stop_codon:yes gene_type:complete
MPQNTPFLELIILKLMVFLPKVFAAVIGAIFGLMLSGDIGKDGKIQVNMSVIIKFTIAVTISLFGGAAHIEFMGYQDYSVMTQGAIMLVWAVFGMLAIGIVYQAVALWQGKTIAEVIKEIKDAAFAIFGK